MLLVEVRFEIFLVKPNCSSKVQRKWFFCLPNEKMPARFFLGFYVTEDINILNALLSIQLHKIFCYEPLIIEARL